jgi:hypothetical protein
MQGPIHALLPSVWDGASAGEIGGPAPNGEDGMLLEIAWATDVGVTQLHSTTL